jgi:penicillin amidase
MMSRKGAALFRAMFLVASSLASFTAFADAADRSRLAVRGLQDEASVVRDRFGVPHLYARSDKDVYFMQGYVHAGDRFFQMDASRRQASGTLAELLGPGPGNQVLQSDVQLRTLGLRRAAERSLAAYPPEVLAVLQAYADGVNARLAQGALPPEYAALELTPAGVPRWAPVDSVAVAKLVAFGLSFDTIDLTNTQVLLTYQGFGSALGFDGTKLFFDDLFRSAPFDPTVSIPDGVRWGAVSHRRHARERSREEDEAVEKARRFLERPAGVPFFAPEGRGEGGSNWWVISGAKTDSRNPMLASDPHLSLSSPSVFHEVHLVVSHRRGQEPMDVYGVGLPGVPGVVHGYNRRIMWGSTVNPMDVTDYFQERVIVAPGGIPVATIFKGVPEPITIIPEIFRVNQVGNSVPDDVVPVSSGVPPATFVVPRRNHGPLVTAPPGADPSNPTAISVQYSGFSATREIETFLRFARAGTVEEFKQALQFFDVGSQNWAYADVDGNIAYFTSAELPLREDLQAGFVDGLPPYFVRDGTGVLRNEWITKDDRPADQALGYEILPFAEMPQLVNPARGYIANGNNDPIGVTLDNNPLNKLRQGGGILYLSPGYAIGNRMGRIDRLIRAELERQHRGGGHLSFEEMMRIQSDVRLVDAEVLTPYILRAFDAARQAAAPAPLQALGADLAIAQAVARLRKWDFSTPTGLADGYDAADRDGRRSKPTREEIASSVAATIYSVWRGQALKNVIDATLARKGLGSFVPPGDRAMIALRHLLDTSDSTGGLGASGLNFFDVQGVALAPAAERDIILLQSLKDALNLLAGPVFEPAFGRSTDQDDYRWGKLHRIVLRHPLGSVFNIPPEPGSALSIDGGFDVVDASSHNPRAAEPAAFMFSSGPSKRFVGEARRAGIHAVQVIPGGASGVPGNVFFGSQVELWATNDYHDAPSSRGDVMRNAVSVEVFEPAP